MSDALALLLTASLRVMAVLAAAWLITLSLRRSSASARHMVWTCALGAAVLAPVLLQIPGWQLTIPETFARWSQPGVTRTVDKPSPVEPTSIAADATSNAPPPASDAATSAGLSPAASLGAVWAAGVVAVLLYVLMGMAATSRLRRASTHTNAGWMDDGRALARSVGIERVAFAESAHASVPFVCGVVNPLVVMPPAISVWDAERRRVVLLHELAHVRRRDCLTHLLAQIACAMYWFHPLTWFAAHRLRIEREQACDDFVLAAGVRGSEYAHHLVAVARDSLPRPSLLASTGVAMAHRSQLEGRLVLILDPATRRTAPRLARLGTVAFALVALGVASLRLQAETPPQTPPVSPMTADVGSPLLNDGEDERRRPVVLMESTAAQAVPAAQPASNPTPVQSPAAAPEPSFEVSSIKRKEPGMAGLRFDPGGRFRMDGPLVMLIGIAYDGGAVRGGPSWLRTDDYSVEARAATDAPRSEIEKMLRSLLRDRLNLLVHRETHEEDAYALVVARDGQLGPQLRKSSVDCAARIAAVRTGQEIPELPPLPNGMPPCISRPRSGDLLTGGMTMDVLASYVRGEVDRRVLNKTGLDGYYEMSLRHRDERTAGDSELPTVFTALSEQLGLRLQPTRTTVETIVIDRVERPTEN